MGDKINTHIVKGDLHMLRKDTHNVLRILFFESKKGKEKREREASLCSCL